MALTIASSGGIINVTFDGATAWNSSLGTGLNIIPGDGIRVKSIQMVPAATDDILIVRKDSATGEILASWKAADAYDSRIKYFHNDHLYKLYVVGAEATTGVMMIVET